MDSDQNLLAQVLTGSDSDDMENSVDAAAAADQPLENEAAPQGQHPLVVSPSRPACPPQLDERVKKAISTARRSFKNQQKQHAAKDLDFIRTELNSACAAAEELFNSWPRLKIPDSSCIDFTEWPTPAPVPKPNPPGVVHPAPSARALRAPKNAITSINNRSVEAPIWILPSHPRVPPYKSWTGIRRNQISMETGQKMFYTEAETGETIPLSDDEGTFTVEQQDSKILEGLQREETNAVLLDVINQLTQQGEDNTAGGGGGGGIVKEEDILEILAWHMGVSLDAMEIRLQELKEEKQGQQDVSQHQSSVNWEEKHDFDSLDTDFYTAFCRMCRKFGCRVHKGAHPRPVMGPMTMFEEKEELQRKLKIQRRLNGQRQKATYEELVIEGREPCGNQCYRLLLAPQELEAEAREAAAAAASQEEGEEEEDAEDEEEEDKEADEEQTNEILGVDPNGLDSDDNSVIDLVSSEEDTSMETAKEGGKHVKEATADAAAGVIGGKNGEVTSPAKQLSKKNGGEQSDLRLPALNAVLAGISTSAKQISAVATGKQAGAKAQIAARAAAAQAAPPPRRMSPTSPPRNNTKGGAAAVAAVAAAATSLIPWNCSACTFRNKGDDLRCEMCETAKVVAATSMFAEAEAVADSGSGLDATPAVPTTSPTIPTDQQQQQQQQQQQGSPSWQLWEDAALEKGIEVWGRQPCKIAVLVGSRTCAQVRHRMMTLLPSPLPTTLNRRNASYGTGNDPTANYDAAGYGDGLYQNRRKRRGGKYTNKQPIVVNQRLKRSTDEAWPQFHPCSCIGPCREGCPCVDDANFCEKFCGCDPAWCGNRFQGCQCKCGVNFNKRCTTRQCPCLAAGRECDPDLCKLCIPTLHNANEPGYQCNNFRIRLRQKRRVLMGLSDVQGWGAFLAGPAVKKDEFIGEYCGELIDQLEADRRGKVYDRDDNSYLFDLNQQWVIDARQKGNKLRFANHSTTANCRAEILLVDGDHRVAILANKDLLPGDELFYDYRYAMNVAPDWAQHYRGGGGGGRGTGRGGRGGRGRGR